MAGCPSWASAFEELASGLDELKSAAGSPTFENPTFAPSWDVRSGRQLVSSESELLESGRQIHGAHSGYGHGCCPLALVVFDMPNPNRYFANFLVNIDIFKKCLYVDNQYGLSIYQTPLPGVQPQHLVCPPRGHRARHLLPSARHRRRAVWQKLSLQPQLGIRHIGKPG